MPLPDDPLATFSDLPSLESMNEIALEAYRLRSSAVCPFCDRSFQDRGQLEKHNLMCTKTKPLHRISSVDRSKNRLAVATEMSPLCLHCGREFKLNQQLKKHLIVCTASKPMKRASLSEGRPMVGRKCGSDLLSSSDSPSIEAKNAVAASRSADAKSVNSTDISLAGELIPTPLPPLIFTCRVFLQ